MQRQVWVSPVASRPLTASSSRSRVPCSPLWRPGRGAAQGAPKSGLCLSLWSLSVGLELELWQLLGQGTGRLRPRLRDISQPPSPVSCPSPASCHCPSALCILLALVPPPLLVITGTAEPCHLVSLHLGLHEDTLLHNPRCPSPVPLKGTGSFEGGRVEGDHSCFSLCAFYASYSSRALGATAAPLGLTPASDLSSPPPLSVASAMHGDSHDRYERLTSVSSSVDFDQRDNVSVLPQTS